MVLLNNPMGNKTKNKRKSVMNNNNNTYNNYRNTSHDNKAFENRAWDPIQFRFSKKSGFRFGQCVSSITCSCTITHVHSPRGRSFFLL